MDKEQLAEYLKKKIPEIERSKTLEDPNKRIVTVHIDSEAFLKMAYLFIGINSK